MYRIILKEFVIAFLIATVLSGFFVGLARSKGRRPGFVGFFLIVLMATWAGGTWLQSSKISPANVQWLPFLAVGSVFAVLAVVFGLRNPPEGRQETLKKLNEVARAKALEKVTYEVLKIVFWVFLIVLAGAILLRYI